MDSNVPTLAPEAPATPSPEVAAPVQTPSKPKSKVPLLLTIWGVLLALVAGVLVFNYTKQSSSKTIAESASVPSPIPTTATILTASPSTSPDLTAGWKTYTNEQYKYSINYPSDWKIDENDMSHIRFYAPDYLEFERLTVDVSNSNPENCRGDCPSAEKVDNVKIGDLKGKKIRGNIGAIAGGCSCGYIEYVFENTGRFYVVTYYGSSKNFTPTPNIRRGCS